MFFPVSFQRYRVVYLGDHTVQTTFELLFWWRRWTFTYQRPFSDNTRIEKL